MNQYRNPRWIYAKFAGTDANGRRFSRGDTLFYYPKDKRILSGEAAHVASRAWEEVQGADNA